MLVLSFSIRFYYLKKILEMCFVSQLKAFLLERSIWGRILNLYNRAEGAALANCLCYTGFYTGAISPEGVMPGGERRRQILLHRAAKAPKQGRNSYKTFSCQFPTTTPQQAFSGS